MLDLRPEDILHKSHLHRLLMEIVDQPVLAQALAFKGGTCAAMLGYLDRFSIDLDFDVLPGVNEASLRGLFHQVFDQLGYSVKLEFENALIFALRYPSRPGQRNTMKISANSFTFAANKYRIQYFTEIDRLINSQTIETMFAHKLIAITDRYAQHGAIAGRDIYDIHHFFVQGYSYHPEVIRERAGTDPVIYLRRLLEFIQEHINQTIIDEDLNSLLPYKKFQQIRKILIPETVSFLNQEIDRQTAERPS